MYVANFGLIPMMPAAEGVFSFLFWPDPREPNQGLLFWLFTGGYR